MNKAKDKLTIKRKNVNVVNMIYREWLESESTKASEMKTNAQIDLMKTLNEKQKALFCKYLDCRSQLEEEAQVQLICFVLDVVKQINSIPKCDEN